ncbi:MAG: hypothetical protein IT372_10975 [Polyangiaceae bacterium]|nr:hypothetical protein [Polyangiaceae bacterium]
MAKADPDARPEFMKPGDNPELDRLVRELRRDGRGGDPFFPGAARREPAPARPEPPAAPAAPAAPVSGARPLGFLSDRRWLWLGLSLVAIAGPIAALALGERRDVRVEVAPALQGDAAAASPRPSPAATVLVVRAGAGMEEDAGVSATVEEDAGNHEDAGQAGAVRRGAPAGSAQGRSAAAADAGPADAAPAAAPAPGGLPPEVF